MKELKGIYVKNRKVSFTNLDVFILFNPLILKIFILHIRTPKAQHEFNNPNTSDNTFLAKPLWLLAVVSCIISAVSIVDSSPVHLRYSPPHLPSRTHHAPSGRGSPGRLISDTTTNTLFFFPLPRIRGGPGGGLSWSSCNF